MSINYRLSPDGCSANAPSGSCVQAIIDAQHDAQAAVRFLRANAATYGVDTDRIAIGGTSAGAITALNVGYNPDDPGTSGNPGQSSAVKGAVSLSGAKILGTAGPGDAPASCSTAPRIRSCRTSGPSTPSTRRGAGLSAFLTTWEGAGHVPYTAHRIEILNQTRNFLYFELDLANAPQGGAAPSAVPAA